MCDRVAQLLTSLQSDLTAGSAGPLSAPAFTAAVATVVGGTGWLQFQRSRPTAPTTLNHPRRRDTHYVGNRLRLGSGAQSTIADYPGQPHPGDPSTARRPDHRTCRQDDYAPRNGGIARHLLTRSHPSSPAILQITGRPREGALPAPGELKNSARSLQRRRKATPVASMAALVVQQHGSCESSRRRRVTQPRCSTTMTLMDAANVIDDRF